VLPEVAFTAFAARLALIMAGGDECGCDSLARVFAGPERAAELVALARDMVAAFDRFSPGALALVLAAHERDVLAGIVGDAG
jgi:hypothetical protein